MNIGDARVNTGVAFSRDGQSLAVCTNSGVVEIWPVGLDQEGTTRKAFRTLGTRSLALFPGAVYEFRVNNDGDAGTDELVYQVVFSEPDASMKTRAAGWSVPILPFRTQLWS